MIEIDFIPEWYKADRVRKRRCAHRYTLFAVLLVVMTLWSFIAGSHVKYVAAEVAGIEAAMKHAKMRVDHSLRLESDIAVMKQKSMVLDQITPRTKATAIIAELAYLIQDNIILSKLSLTNEEIEDVRQNGSSGSKAVVRIGTSQKDQDPIISETPSRLKVVLTGIAARPADAASLIARLEDAEYFEQVALVFSKPKEARGQDVTEFEIQCYIADYQIRK